MGIDYGGAATFQFHDKMFSIVFCLLMAQVVYEGRVRSQFEIKILNS